MVRKRVILMQQDRGRGTTMFIGKLWHIYSLAARRISLTWEGLGLRDW
jgi:hypothetical protein